VACSSATSASRHSARRARKAPALVVIVTACRCVRAAACRPSLGSQARAYALSCCASTTAQERPAGPRRHTRGERLAHCAVVRACGDDEGRRRGAQNSQEVAIAQPPRSQRRALCCRSRWRQCCLAARAGGALLPRALRPPVCEHAQPKPPFVSEKKAASAASAASAAYGERGLRRAQLTASAAYGERSLRRRTGGVCSNGAEGHGHLAC
jgi:hypothetical protein